MGKDMRIGVKPIDKRTKTDCAGGKQCCGDCETNPNIISLETLLQGLEEYPCKGSSCDACGECEVIVSRR